MFPQEEINKIVYKLKEIYKKKGYSFFDAGSYNVNLIGIRSKKDEPKKFNDKGMIVYKNPYGEWQVFVFEMTTDPGLYYRNKPLNVLGTGIMCEGQHRGLYSKGKHKGMDALIQSRSVWVYRDNDKDDNLDLDNKMLAEPSSGFNLHGAFNNDMFREGIGKTSAGCQVVPDRAKYSYLINIVYYSMGLYGDSLTYTLFREKDLK